MLEIEKVRVSYTFKINFINIVQVCARETIEKEEKRCLKYVNLLCHVTFVEGCFQ